MTKIKKLKGIHVLVSGSVGPPGGELSSRRLYIAVTNPPKNPISPVANGSTSLVASGLGTNIETSIRRVPAPTVKVTMFPTVVNPWSKAAATNACHNCLSTSARIFNYVIFINCEILNNSLESVIA